MSAIPTWTLSDNAECQNDDWLAAFSNARRDHSVLSQGCKQVIHWSKWDDLSFECAIQTQKLWTKQKKKKKIQYSASHNLFWTGTVSSVSHYTAKWIVWPCGMNFTMTLCLSQNMVHKPFSVEIVCLNLLIFWDSRCFYCIECHFDSCVLKDAHVSSPVPAYVWILSPCSVKKFQNTYVFCKKKKKKTCTHAHTQIRRNIQIPN